MKPLELKGRIFGFLTVVKRVENSKDGSTRWLCLCECGNQHVVRRRELVRGKTKSCGCKWGKQGRFSKGMTPWNKGLPTPEIVREKLSKAKKGKTAWNKGKGSGRNSVAAKEWRANVLERDNNECIKCGSKENLHCDHIIPWKKSVELRFDVSNGQTLCRSCHLKKSIKHKEVVSVPFKTGDAYWKGRKRSEETKIKISQTKKGVKLSEETKEKMRGRVVSAETRKKMSNSHKKRLKKIRESQS